MNFEISYEITGTRDISDSYTMTNVESEAEARETAENFLESQYPGEDGYILHSLAVTPVE